MLAHVEDILLSLEVQLILVQNQIWVETWWNSDSLSRGKLSQWYCSSVAPLINLCFLFCCFASWRRIY